MTTIHYRETVHHGQHLAELIEEYQSYDLETFANLCEQSPAWVLQLLEYDILTPRTESLNAHFDLEDLSRAQQAARLQRDFKASVPALALMLDLIDEVQDLRRSLKSPHLGITS